MLDARYWDQRYDTGHYIYGTAPNEFLAAHAGLIPKGRVLCLAEGEGRNAAFLAGLGHDVVGVDHSAVALAKARRLCEERGVRVELIEGDLGTFDPGEAAWDGIVSSFCHVPGDVRKRLHARVARALRPGGVLLLEAYSPAQLGRTTGGRRTCRC